MPAFTLAEAALKFVADQAGLRTELVKSEQVAERGARRIGDVLNKHIADAAKKAGKALTVNLTAPILALGTVLTRAAVGIDNAFSTIRRQTGATGRDLSALRDDFRSVFGDADESAEEVARVLSDLNTRLGLTGTSLRSATTAVLNFADVTGDDAVEATRSVTRLLNAMGLSAERIPDILDKLTAASQRTGISANRLAELVAHAGPAFQALGFDLDRTIALLAQFERAGADPEQVVQSLNILFRQFAKAGITDAGIAFEAFLAKIREAPDLVRATGIASDVFGRQALAVARAVRTGAFEVDGLAASLRTSQGVLRRTADESEQFGEKLGRLRNRISLAFEPLGRVLLDSIERNIPAIENLIQKTARLAESLAALPRPVQSGTIAFAALLAVAGPLLIFFGALIGAVTKISEVFSKAAPIVARFAGFLLRIAPAGTVAVAVLGAFAGQAEKMATINRALQAGMTPKLLPEGFANDARLLEQAYNTARAFLRIRGELQLPAFVRKRTIAEERRGLLPAARPATPPSTAAAPAISHAAALKDIPATIDRITEADRKMVEEAEAADVALKLRVQRYDEAYNAAVRLMAAEDELRAIQRTGGEAGQVEPRGAADIARERLDELNAARSRSISILQQEIAQLRIIAAEEAQREQTETDADKKRDARLNRLRAEADIENRLLEIARLRVDDARALLDLTQLEHSLGLKTAGDVDAARRQSLAALLAQLQTARDLNATQAELVPILQDILRIQEDLIRGDFVKAWAQAVQEAKVQTIDWLTSARQFFANLPQGLASALRAFGTEGKTILETLGNLARAVFDAAFTQVTNNLAQTLTSRIAGLMEQIFPALAQMPLATEAVGAGPLAAAGVSLGTAGAGLTAAGVGLNAAAIALSAAAAALTVSAAASGAGDIFSTLAMAGVQHGGLVTAPMLAALAEAGRPELVQPIPRGMSLREMADTMRAVAERPVGGDTFVFPNLTVRNDDDIRRIGREVANSMRAARRGNHPFFREGR